MPVKGGTNAKVKADARLVMLVALERIHARAMAVVPQVPSTSARARTIVKARVVVVQVTTVVPVKTLVKAKEVVGYRSRKAISVNG